MPLHRWTIEKLRLQHCEATGEKMYCNNTASNDNIKAVGLSVAPGNPRLVVPSGFAASCHISADAGIP
jgi:hypothetical protein